VPIDGWAGAGLLDFQSQPDAQMSVIPDNAALTSRRNIDVCDPLASALCSVMKVVSDAMMVAAL